MKTTVDLPEALVHRAKVVAAERRTTLKALVIHGLNQVLSAPAAIALPQGALGRLHQGLRLGRQPLTRDQAHERD